MRKELPPLPPSFDPGSGADEQAKSAALRHQGATSVVSGYEGYRGPESSNWQYCRELTPEELAERNALMEDLRKQAAAENTGSNGTFRTPEDNQSDILEPGQEDSGRFGRFVRRGLGAAAAFAVAVGGMFGVGHAAGEVNRAHMTTSCQEFAMDGSKSLPDGLVGVGDADRQEIQEYLNESGGNHSVADTSLNAVYLNSDPQSGRFEEGSKVTVCVRTDLTGSDASVSYNTVHNMAKDGHLPE